MSLFDIYNDMMEIEKDYFTFADMEKIISAKRESLYVILNRLVKKGLLQRVTKGIYKLKGKNLDIESFACSIYFPSYISFEWALAKYGTKSQIPYTLTMATIRKTKEIRFGEVRIEYRKIRPDLLWGYDFIDKAYIAWPEKALLDQLYLVSQKKAYLNFEELDLKEISRRKLLSLSKSYPQSTQRLVEDLSKQFGKFKAGVR